MRTCNACTHHLACYARHSMSEMIQDFRLLALDHSESKNCGTTGTAEDLYMALAAACTAFVEGE